MVELVAEFVDPFLLGNRMKFLDQREVGLSRYTTE